MNLPTILHPFARASKVAAALMLVAGLLFCLIVAIATNTEPATAATTCSSSLQAKINAAPAGGTVKADACVYREAVSVNKPLTIDGGGTAEIRGSDVWSEWSAAGGNWVSTRTVPALSTEASPHCETGHPECAWPEQVFVDGQRFVQVSTSTDPEAGQFRLDSGRHIVLGEDPSGKIVEVTTRAYILNAGANNVTVKNLTMRHAGNKPQTGAVTNKGFDNFTLDNVRVLYAHGANVSFTGGSSYNARSSMIGSVTAYAGQLGIHNSKGDITIRGGECAHNNIEGFNDDWEAGCSKFSGIQNSGNFHRVLVDGMHVHDNEGPGLWTDMDARNVTFSNNRIHDNTKSGIFFEISNGADIFGNVAYNNGWKKPEWGWGAQISIASSKNANVHDNTVAWGPDGISVISQNRWELDYKNSTGIKVHHNRILQEDKPSVSGAHGLAWLQDHAGVLFKPSSGNVGYNNAYWYPTAPGATRFAWNGTYSALSAFNSTLGEEAGSYLTTEEKDTLVTQHALPTYAWGLKGEYYDNQDFTAFKATRSDPDVNFNWGSGAPMAGMGVDSFSVRWTGQVYAPTSGAYVFYTTVNDGVRLYVDGQRVIGRWSNGNQTNSATVSLSADWHDLRMEMYEGVNSARAILEYDPPGTEGRTVIAGSRLRHAV